MATKTNYDDVVILKGTPETDNITNSGSNVTISAGKGNDSISNGGTNVSINGGKGNDYIHNESGDQVTLSGGAGNDTLIGSRFAEVFVYEGGKDVITNYSGEDTIQIASDKIDSYSFKGNDLIFKIGSGSLRLNNMINHAIIIKDISQDPETITDDDKEVLNGLYS